MHLPRQSEPVQRTTVGRCAPRGDGHCASSAQGRGTIQDGVEPSILWPPVFDIEDIKRMERILTTLPLPTPFPTGTLPI
jgi:hypothetical protein